MTNNAQLPAEVVQSIKNDADRVYNKLDDLAHDQDSCDFGLPMINREVGPIVEILTEYATKLHQVEQEIAQLKQWQIEAIAVLDPILEYGRSKEAGIPLGKSITSAVIERCKQYQQAKQMLFRLASLVNADQIPDDKFLTEIKTFLDGKK